jgi:hypothetical protein
MWVASGLDESRDLYSFTDRGRSLVEATMRMGAVRA